MPRQDGRTIVVTGATSGIGLQTARILAAFGAHVVLAVRNPDKGEAVARELTGSTEVRRLDVSDLASVRRFAKETGPVDVLVNNAGIMAVPFARTTDGFESQRMKVASMKAPTAMVTITAPAMASGSGTNAWSVTAVIPPSITNSPWAKLMMPVVL